MKKKIIGAFAVVIFMSCLFMSQANAIILKLEQDDIAEAVEYGKKSRRVLLGDFTKPWTVKLGDDVGWATIYTSFHNIAFKARKATIENKELTSKQINKALEIGEVLTFTVSVLGNNMTFAQEYHGMLQHGKKIIAPVFEYVPEESETSEYWPNMPDHVAGCVFKFSTRDIGKDDKVTLILKPFDGDVIEFKFNLSKMK